MTLHPGDTIAALASAAGPAARGIVRVSGLGTKSVLETIFTPAGQTPEKLDQRVPWCYSGALQIASLARPLPVDLYFWPDRRSYTGEPLAELHTIGSPPILEAILSEFFARGVRAAQPGEFTLRAFLAGRIDLTQAEAVLGVIDARTENELQAALEQLAGGLSSQIIRLRGDLLDLLADLEAGLDFADEPIEFVSHATLVGRLGLARDAVAELAERAEERMRPPSRPCVVLAGPPNAGKSTLFNSLAGAAAGGAIVSEIGGTTRDYLASEVSLEGLPIVLVDTAGHEPPSDGISHEAQKRCREQIDQADLIVWCNPADQPILNSPGDNSNGAVERVFPVVTKCDLPAASSTPASQSAQLAVSAHSGIGLRELASAIVARLSDATEGGRQFLGTTFARSSDSIKKAHSALNRALQIARNESDQELLAIEVRDALDELGKIAGAVYTDDILDRVFSRFCIGK